MSKLKIIYIAGVGRNGSTLVSRILGENDNCINIGEALSYMLNKTLRSRHSKNVMQSPFWLAVFKEIGFNYISDDFENLLKESKHNEVTKRIKSRDVYLLEIQQKTFQFLQGIQKISGKDIIIESSKNPIIPLLFIESKIIDVRILHITRVISSIVKSRSKNKEYLQKASFLKVLARWIRRNEASIKLKKFFKYFLCSFESFSRDPYESLKAVYKWADINEEPISSLKDRKIVFTPQPIIAGNPDKFTSGEIEIFPSIPNNNSSLKFYIAKILTYPTSRKLKN